MNRKMMMVVLFEIIALFVIYASSVILLGINIYDIIFNDMRITDQLIAYMLVEMSLILITSGIEKRIGKCVTGEGDP